LPIEKGILEGDRSQISDGFDEAEIVLKVCVAAASWTEEDNPQQLAATTKRHEDFDAIRS
jgi:hypothetical protein